MNETAARLDRCAHSFNTTVLYCAEAEQERCERQSMCGKVPQRNAVHKRSTSTKASRLRRAGSPAATARGSRLELELIQRVGKNRNKDCWAVLLSWHRSNSNRDNKPRVHRDRGTSKKHTLLLSAVQPHASGKKGKFSESIGSHAMQGLKGRVPSVLGCKHMG